MKRDANPEKGLEALDQCEYMVLAMTDGEGKPYCIPLNGVRVGEKIYFHCAKAGEKVDCLRTHPQVCLTAVGHQRVIQAIYETEYQCAVVRGTAGEVSLLSKVCFKCLVHFFKWESVCNKFLNRQSDCDCSL